MRHASRSFGSLRVKTPTLQPGLRVGLMGGSFNPPHEGHLWVAETALKRLGLDQLWWIVSPGNPLKSHDGLAPLDARMAACRALAQNPRMKITGFEAELGSPYTAITLGHLVQRNPGVHFVWVMGADNLAGFHRWQNWQGIARSIPFAVVDRPGWRLRGLAGRAAKSLETRRVPESHAPQLPLAKTPAWTFLSARLSEQSSTAIRRQNPVL